jgi:hypothetical protein
VDPLKYRFGASHFAIFNRGLSMFNLYFLVGTLAIAEQPIDDTAGLQSDENTVTNDTTEEDSPDIGAQLVDVTIELVNGIELNGSAPLMEVIYWEPGSPIHFTPRGGEQVLIEGERINSSRLEEVLETAVATAQLAANSQPISETYEELIDYTSPRGFSYPNPAASRYLYAPSAIPMKVGQGYVSQKLLFTAGAYAVTDNFTALLGTFTFFPPLLTVAGGKYATSLSDKIHVSVGAEVFLVPIDTEVAAGVAFGSVTYGDADKHITFATGAIGGEYIGDFLDEDVSIPLMVGGHIRKSSRTAFVTENWLIIDPALLRGNILPPPPIVAFATTAAFRLIGKRDVKSRRKAYLISTEGFPRTTWDFGLVFAVYRDSYRTYLGGGEYTSEFASYSPLGPLPWIDYTWHFGPSK